MGVGSARLRGFANSGILNVGTRQHLAEAARDRSQRPMRRTQELVADAGATATNWFAHTPVCCPSRSQLLTGRYFHNLRMPTPAGGCMHVQTGVAGKDDKVNDLLSTLSGAPMLTITETNPSRCLERR